MTNCAYYDDLTVCGCFLMIVYGVNNDSEHVNLYPCDVNTSNVPVVGIQGNPIGPLWSTYEVTQDSTFLDTAHKIIEGTMSQVVWSEDCILKTYVDSEWNNQDLSWWLSKAGVVLFKGIFVRYLGVFVQNLMSIGDNTRTAAAKKYTQFLQNNADTLWLNYPKGIFSMNWNSKLPDYQPPFGPQEKINRLNASLQYVHLFCGWGFIHWKANKYENFGGCRSF